MRATKWTCVLVTGVLAWSAACSSDENEAGGEGQTGAAPPTLNPGSGGSGGTGASGMYAESTPDGLLSITAEEAATLADPETVCAGWSAEPEGGGPPVLEFVIDVTGSMADLSAYPQDPANAATRWQEMQRVLPGVFQSLPEDWVVGVSYYRKPDNGCYEPDQSVPIGILDAAKKAEITASIERRGPKPDTNDADNVQGATPTLAAWRFGLSELTAWAPPPGYEGSPRYVVVITDGVPTVESDGCTYTNPITQAEYDLEVEIVRSEGQAANARTFIVGVLGSEQTQNATYDPLYMLSQMAIAGRTEVPAGCVPTSGTVDSSVEPSVMTSRGSYCHYDLSDSGDFAGSLVSALGSIAQSVVSCDYVVPPPPNPSLVVDPNLTNLVYDDGAGGYSLVLQSGSDVCDRGWRFTDASRTSLEICGQTCDLLQSNPAARLAVVFGCQTGEVPEVR